MARGNEVIVNPDWKGKRTEGIISGALLPGTVVQIDPTVALVGGRHTWKAYDRVADGDRPAGPLGILTEDNLQGRVFGTAYASGDRGFIYIPVPGEELNVLAKFGDTSDTHTKGEVMMVDDGTGKLIATTGAPQQAPFTLLETVTLTADACVWVVYGL